MNTTTMSSPAIEQFAGKGAARAARRRGARMESGQRKPGLRSYLVLVIVLLVSAAPLYYAFLLASSTATSIAQHAIPSLVPEGHLLENIRRVMNSDIGIWQAFRNSLVVAVLTSLSVMFFSTLAGFAFAKLRFRGKGGIEHDVVLDDAKLARLLRNCQQLPGQHLFQYQDDELPLVIGNTARVMNDQSLREVNLG